MEKHLKSKPTVFGTIVRIVITIFSFLAFTSTAILAFLYFANGLTYLYHSTKVILHIFFCCAIIFVAFNILGAFIVLMFRKDFNEFWIISEKVEFSQISES